MDPVDIDAGEWYYYSSGCWQFNPLVVLTQPNHAVRSTSELEGKFDLPTDDPDGDKIKIYVTALPARGMLRNKDSKLSQVELGVPLKKSTLVFVPEPMEGGAPYASFTVEVGTHESQSC